MLVYLPGTRWGSMLSCLSVLLTKYKVIHETLLSARILTRNCRFYEMHEKFWVCHRDSDHTTYHWLCEITILGSTKNLAVISFRHRLKLVAQRLPSENKELKLYILIYTNAQLRPLRKQSTSLQRNHDQPPLVARSIAQMLKLIRQRHTSERIFFAHLRITSLGKWSDVSQRKWSLYYNIHKLNESARVNGTIPWSSTQGLPDPKSWKMEAEGWRSWDELQHIDAVDDSSKLWILSKHTTHVKTLSQTYQSAHAAVNDPSLLWDVSRHWLRSSNSQNLLSGLALLRIALLQPGTGELCYNVFVLHVFCTMFCSAFCKFLQLSTASMT